MHDGNASHLILKACTAAQHKTLHRSLVCSHPSPSVYSDVTLFLDPAFILMTTQRLTLSLALARILIHSRSLTLFLHLRYDAQVVMAVFSYLYLNNWAARHTVTVGYVLSKALELEADQMLDFFAKARCGFSPGMGCSTARSRDLRGGSTAVRPCLSRGISVHAHTPPIA